MKKQRKWNKLAILLAAMLAFSSAGNAAFAEPVGLELAGELAVGEETEVLEEETSEETEAAEEETETEEAIGEETPEETVPAEEEAPAETAPAEEAVETETAEEAEAETAEALEADPAEALETETAETVEDEAVETVVEEAGDAKIPAAVLEASIEIWCAVTIFTEKKNNNESIEYDGKTYYEKNDGASTFIRDKGSLINDKNELIEEIKSDGINITDIKAVFKIYIDNEGVNYYPTANPLTFPITVNPNWSGYGDPELHLFVLCSTEKPVPATEHTITAVLDPPEEGDSGDIVPEIRFEDYEGDYFVDKWYTSIGREDPFTGTFEAGKTYFSSLFLYPVPLRENMDTVVFHMAGNIPFDTPYIDYENGQVVVDFQYTIPSTQFDPVKITGAVNTTGGVVISWRPDSREASYKVYRSRRKEGSYEADNRVELGSNINGSSFTVPPEGLVSGNLYQYEVQAYKAGTLLSEDVIVKRYIGATVMNAPTCTAKGLRVTWPKVQGAQKYVIYRHSGAGAPDWKYLTSVSASDNPVQVYNNNGTFEPGGWYAYTVRAIGADNIYGGQPAGRSVRFRQPVKITKVQSISSGVRATFTTVAAGYTYGLYRAPVTGGTPGTYTRVATVVNSSVGKDVWITDTTAVSGKGYSYYVRCLSKDLAVPLSSYANDLKITYKKPSLQ